jgi:hypothetical protein
MKKTALALPPIVVLLLLTVLFQFGFVAANPIGNYFPYDPHTIITVQYPENRMQFSARTITLRFSLNLSLWYPSYLYEYNPSYSCNVSSIEYYLDGDFAGNLTEIAHADKFINLTATLYGLADGKHTLEIKITTNGIYWHQVGGWRPGDIPAWDHSRDPIFDSSGLVNFTINAKSPSITVLSPANNTYALPDIPLNFTVKEPASQVAYCLDGKESIIIFGNTTLTGLANGDHNITVYAKNDAGDIKVSETLFFNVKVPAPFPTATVVTVSGISAVVVIGASLLVYFKKRKH